MRQLALLALLLFLVSACGSGEAPPPDGAGGPEGGGDPAGEGIGTLEAGEGEATPPPPPPPPADPLAKLKIELGRRKNSVDEEERAGAILLLTECEDLTFAGKEIEQYLNDESPDVRALAADGIGQIEYRGAASSLKRVLATDKDAMVRNRAIRSLYIISGKSSVPELIRVLSNDDDGSVRTSAASLLGDSGSKLGVDTLIKAVAEDFNVGVRQAALTSLEKIGAPSALDVAITVLQDMNATVRVAAASFVQSLGDEKAIPALINLLEDEEEAPVLKAVTAALSKLTGEKLLYASEGDPEENEAVLQAWKDWWEENRED